MNENYAKFWKCALQVNPWTYAQNYQAKGHGLSEDDYNDALAARCVKNDIQVVGIADHGCVDGSDKLRKALEEKGIVVFPGFEIASTGKRYIWSAFTLPPPPSAHSINIWVTWNYLRGRRKPRPPRLEFWPSQNGCSSKGAFGTPPISPAPAACSG